MFPDIKDLLAQMGRLEEELQAEFARRRTLFHFRLEAGRVRFEQEVERYHRQLRQTVFSILRRMRARDLVALLVTLSIALPLVMLDLFLALYQLVCFGIWDVPRVRRRDYILIDRHHLAYLNWLQKFNCVYCGYANGLAAYLGEIAGRTEQFWCPIKHAQRTPAAHRYYAGFVDYGDAQSYHSTAARLREELRSPTGHDPE